MSTARQALILALDDLDEQGRRTPCQGRHSHRWTSDDADEREWAAHMCRMCPLLPECAAAADEAKERHHVWAGVDRTPKPRTKKAS